MSDNRKLLADRGMMHALLCAVSHMDSADRELIFRASMPSLGSLFGAGENMISLTVAVERALKIVEQGEWP